ISSRTRRYRWRTIAVTKRVQPPNLAVETTTAGGGPLGLLDSHLPHTERPTALAGAGVALKLTIPNRAIGTYRPVPVPFSERKETLINTRQRARSSRNRLRLQRQLVG